MIASKTPLNQLVKSILEINDAEGDDTGFAVFAVVIAATEIGFFEYHTNANNLYEEGIPNFRGCVSLTYDYSVDRVM